MRTLALLALFTIGSAEVVACGGSATTDTVCKTATHLIGKCSGPSGSCGTKKHCKPGGGSDKSENAECGHNSDRNLQGRCEADGDCKYTVSLKIDYTIQATADAVGEFNTNIASGQLKSGMEAEMDQTVVSLFKPCQALATSVADTNITGGHLECGNNFAGDTCDLVCDATYDVKVVSLKKCIGKTTADGGSAYNSGAVGTCEKSCPMPAGAVADPNNRVGAFTLPITNGTVECDGVFVDSKCELTCNSTSRTVVGHPTSTSTCSLTGGPSSTAKFAAETGACEPASSHHSTANVWLNHEDVAADVIARTDTDFIDDFKKGIAKSLTKVLPEHVTVVAITRLGNPGARRLKEVPVQIDYSVQVPAGDPEGATELPSVGAGLRGIR